MTESTSRARKRQLEWARARKIRTDAAGYVETPSDNFFAPLSAATQAELAAGDGGELGAPGKPGKIQALHSSSALACNVFDYWRERDSLPLSRALGLAAPIAAMAFERKYPTGLPGTPPNLDVVLTLTTGRTIAIESKFLEPFTAHARATFSDSYFPESTPLWQAAGFSRCQALAEALHSGTHATRWLDTEQLLKHILGLQRAGGDWSLLYLWFDVGGPAATDHAAETEHFAATAAADGMDFRALTYQSVFREVKHASRGPDRAYVDYLGSRYFDEAV